MKAFGLGAHDAMAWRRWTASVLLALAAAVGVLTGGSALADPTETAAELLSRDPDYAAGKDALARKEWPEAVRRFKRALVRNPDEADVHNELGFAYRHLRDYDLAFRHYGRALELDPVHRGAHEYIGEAYLMVDNVAKAEEHLAALQRICLLPCEELEDLKRAIDEYAKRRK